MANANIGNVFKEAQGVGEIKSRLAQIESMFEGAARPGKTIAKRVLLYEGIARMAQELRTELARSSSAPKRARKAAPDRLGETAAAQSAA